MNAWSWKNNNESWINYSDVLILFGSLSFMSVMNTWSPQCPQPFLCSLTLLLLHHIIIRKNTLWSFFFIFTVFQLDFTKGNKPCTTAKLTLMFSITNRRSSITKAIARIKLDWNQSKFKAKNQGFCCEKDVSDLAQISMKILWKSEINCFLTCEAKTSQKQLCQTSCQM